MSSSKHQLRGKTVFVAGGSSGLGKEIAKALASQGAHVTIFARRQQPLAEAKNEIIAARSSINQEIHAVSLDLANPLEVKERFESQPRIADTLYCVAGGTINEMGFIVDIGPDELERCMRNNYLTSAYPAQTMLKIWTEDDKNLDTRPNLTRSPIIRRIVFISSAAAFVGLPGYIAYTPTKCAVRALADTLRSEVLRYSSPASKYTVHCAFPSNFISPAFIDEQKTKPALTKRMEGTYSSIPELTKKLHSSEYVARHIITAAERGEFAICSELESAVLFANMMGPSPARGWGIIDSLVALLMRIIIWPVLRYYFDAMCRKDSTALENSI